MKKIKSVGTNKVQNTFRSSLSIESPLDNVTIIFQRLDWSVEDDDFIFVGLYLGL